MVARASLAQSKNKQLDGVGTRDYFSHPAKDYSE